MIGKLNVNAGPFKGGWGAKLNPCEFSWYNPEAGVGPLKWKKDGGLKVAVPKKELLPQSPVTGKLAAEFCIKSRF